jgi:TRAP-type C4-dicarboxylate transport system substrate-binding protein
MFIDTRKWLGKCALAGAAVGAAMSLSVAAQADPTEMTVGVIYSIDRPQGQVWTRMQELVDAELPGALKFNIVPDGALGGEKEEVEGVRLGSIQAGLSTLANMTTWVPEAALFEAQGFKVFGFITYGARHVISKDPITGPEDVKGKNMRVLQSPLHIELWSSLGANPTPVPITEAYNALGSGVVDYMDMTMSGYRALKLYEVVPNFSRTSHIWALGVMYMGLPFWESLTPEQQAALESAAAEAIPYFNELAAAEQEAALADTLEQGATVIEQDVSAWQAAMEPFWESYADNVGGIEKVRAVANTQ